MRGRGGKGSGEEVRSAPMVTRSSVELPSVRVYQSDSDDDDPQTPQAEENHSKNDKEPCVAVSGSEVRDELKIVRAQLEELKKTAE